LADELIVPMGDLKVAIRLPEDLQSADRLKFDFSTGLSSLSIINSELSFFRWRLKEPAHVNTSARRPEISFSPRAEDYIRRFMEAVERIKPTQAWSCHRLYISGTSTNKVTAK